MNRVHDASVHSRQEAMIRQQVMERGITDERVIAALRAVPRERFFPVGAREYAFADRASAIGHGQTISQPYMVALMTARLNVQPEHRVLEIGTGSGYQTAILAQLAGEVWTIERVKPLLDESFDRLLEMGVRNVHYRLGDGTLGWPDAAPFDRILIGAGAPALPTRLLNDQLAEGGIAVVPFGDSADQLLVEVQKQDGVLQQTELCACRFVKLIGEEGWSEDLAE
jgi:protein-L-isoaspartate(D-aspartate) O-methyltransferase